MRLLDRAHRWLLAGLWPAALPPPSRCRCRARGRRSGSSRTASPRRSPGSISMPPTVTDRPTALRPAAGRHGRDRAAAAADRARRLRRRATWSSSNAVLLADKAPRRVEPAAVLRCAMAESARRLAARRGRARRQARSAARLRAVENYDDYECRSRNRVAGAKLSEHGKGNAIDVRALHARRRPRHRAHRRRRVDKHAARSACAKPPAAASPPCSAPAPTPITRATSISISIARRNGYRICQWDVRVPPPPPEPGADGASSAAAPAPGRWPTRAVKHSGRL